MNKRRRQEGRTPNQTTQGTGNPRHTFADRSKQELYNLAKELGLAGRCKVQKSPLVEAISHHG